MFLTRKAIVWLQKTTFFWPWPNNAFIMEIAFFKMSYFVFNRRVCRKQKMWSFGTSATSRSAIGSDEVSRCFRAVMQVCDVLILRWTPRRTLCVWEPCSSYTPVISIWTSSFKTTARVATCRPPGSVYPASTSKPRSQSKQLPEPVNSDLWPDRLSRPWERSAVI